MNRHTVVLVMLLLAKATTEVAAIDHKNLDERRPLRRVVFSLAVLLLLLIGCSEDSDGTDRHASVDPCSIQAVATSPGGHVAFPASDGALIVAVPALSPQVLPLEILTSHDVVAPSLRAACPFSSRAPPHIRSF